MADGAPPSTGETAAGDIARRIALELMTLRDVVFQIECTVGGLLLANCSVGTGQHRDLQALDSLGQTLEGLAEFLDGTAAMMRPEWQFDPAAAASALKLRDLAARLGDPAGDAADTPPAGADDCVFF